MTSQREDGDVVWRLRRHTTDSTLQQQGCLRSYKTGSVLEEKDQRMRCHHLSDMWYSFNRWCAQHMQVIFGFPKLL